MRRFVDLKNMPNFNPEVKDETDSVSTGKVRLKAIQRIPDYECGGLDIDEFDYSEDFFLPGNLKEYTQIYPYCTSHGAMNKVSKDGIWRCLTCGVGAYEIE